MDKYIIDGVEYSYGEEVEVSNDNVKWYKDILKEVDTRQEKQFLCSFRNWNYIRKIQPTQYEGSSGRFIYGEKPKYKTDYDALKDLFDNAYKSIKSNILLRNYINPPLSGRKEIKKIDTSKIRGAFQEVIYNEQGSYVAGGDDTIKSIEYVAETVNEIIDVLNTNNLSGQKAKLTLGDGTELNVTID